MDIISFLISANIGAEMVAVVFTQYSSRKLRVENIEIFHKAV